MRWETEPVSCPVCSAGAFIPLFHNDAHGFGLRTVFCTDCGLVYLNPRPTAAEYERLYSGIYENLFPTAWELPLAELKANRRLEWYKKYLSPGINLLEVGPGDGAFLKLLKEQTEVSAFGIEPSPKAVEVCRRRGLDVQQGYLSCGDKRFNALAAFHVLEHSLDPIAMLRQFWQSLEFGGILLIEVPNITGSWHGLGMIHIAHPQQFCPATLGIALNKAGFEVMSLDAIEEPVFESSIRAIARKAQHPQNKIFRPPVSTIPLIFQERLANWKFDLLKYRLKRLVFRYSGIAALKKASALRKLSTAT